MPHIEVKWPGRTQVEGEDVGPLPPLVGRPVSSGLYPRCHVLLYTHRGPSGPGVYRLLIDQVAELAQRTGGVKATGWQLVLIVIAEPGTADELVEHHQHLLSDGITILQETEGGVLQRYGVTGVPTGLALDAHGHLLDQTLNPHITWLYKTLRVSAPSEPITTGWQSKRGPVIEVPV